MFVKPGTGRDGLPLSVRVPHTRALLPETGAEVPANSFWIRRLRDGDVVEASPGAEPAPETHAQEG